MTRENRDILLPDIRRLTEETTTTPINLCKREIANNYLMSDSITIQNSNIMPLFDDLRQIINQTRNRVAVNVNAELTLMYWHIGERINREVLGNERAEYGKQIVPAVSTQLQSEFGKKGFEPRSIWRMMQFASMFPDIKIVTPLVTQLSWSTTRDSSFMWLKYIKIQGQIVSALPTFFVK